jgi:hypothetical protein
MVDHLAWPACSGRFVARDFAVFVQAEFDIGKAAEDCVTNATGAHPLHANGFANGLRQDHGFFAASVPPFDLP